MALSRKATEMRASDKTLKTQLRWGDKDVEIHVKTKGSEENYRKMNLRSNGHKGKETTSGGNQSSGRRVPSCHPWQAEDR